MDLMELSSYRYDLPEELIAQTPLALRSSSRLLSFDRESGQVKHGTFTDIEGFLKPGDCLVLNDTRVIPARLWAHREGKEEEIEIVLLSQEKDEGIVWKCLTRPGKKTKPGTELILGGGRLKGTVTEIAEEGTRLIRFSCDRPFLEVIEEIGLMPLPPYIKERLEDKDRYQTVYANEKGSAAAPTAGLHFTPELLKRIEDKGVHIEKVLLHVGLGTFRPVKAENVEEHVMHSEFYQVTQEAADKINAARAAGHRCVCVGTTSVRTLETVTTPDGIVHPGQGDTAIFITPGVKIKAVDALITNFHLPESTLLMLISALMGRENALETYEEAVKERYRFFSFGDAMLIC